MAEQTEIDAVHERIRQRMDELKTTPHAVSLAIGKDKSYLRKLFARPGSRPGIEAATELAKILKLPVSELAANAEPGPRAVPEPDRLPDSLPAVPVRGTVAGSHELGAFQFDGSDVDYVQRYPALAGRPRVYALYVEGDSMVPEHKPGDIRFVDPAAPVRLGDTVVVSVIDPDRGLFAVLGNLAGRGEEIVLDKLNPERKIRFSRLLVRSIHHVLTANELAGK